jgi:hypothetical protein
MVAASPEFGSNAGEHRQIRCRRISESRSEAPARHDVI